MNSARLQRADSYGTPIKKGVKKHKVAFSNEKLVEVFEVENWKKYNQDETEEQNVSCCAKCGIY